MTDDWGIRVKVARVRRGWTQEDLCDACSEHHFGSSTWRILVWAIEGGLVEPIGKVAAILEKVLGDDPTSERA